MKKIVVIFDMNGTIVDSEMAHWKAYHDVLIDYGIEFSLDEFSLDFSTYGRKLDFTLKKHGREDLVKDVKELKKKKNIIFRSTTKDLIKPMPHVHKTLKYLKKGNVKIALDSTSARRDIGHILEDNDLDGFFHLITSGDMDWDNDKYGEITKSNRFKYIADELGIDSSNCVVVGDAEKDMLAAKRNKMRAVGVPNKYTKNNDFSKADSLLQHLKELNLDLVFKLIENN